MCNKSETITELAKALVKFNTEVSRISKDAANPFFKNNYATLDNIIDEVRPILTKNGLSILQIPGGDGENVVMKTMLMHESGEWIESDPLIMKPVKNDPQSVGSCVTYARRYSLAAFLSLNTGEDDDGNNASQQQRSTASSEPVQARTQQTQPNTQPRQQNAPQVNTAYTGGNMAAKVYKLREEMEWSWPDLNQFASDVLGREIKYLKANVKTDDEWRMIEQAMTANKDAMVRG